jgi:hypothetical protein
MSERQSDSGGDGHPDDGADAKKIHRGNDGAFVGNGSGRKSGRPIQGQQHERSAEPPRARNGRHWGFLGVIADYRGVQPSRDFRMRR